MRRTKYLIAQLMKAIISLLGWVTIKPFLLLERQRIVARLPEDPKILFISLAYRGDLVLCAPAIAALKTRFPKSSLTLWVREYNYSLATLIPGVDRIITYDDFAIEGLAIFGNLLAWRRHRQFRQLIRSYGFDISIDDAGYLFTMAACLAARIPLRIGRNKQGFGFLCHYEFPYDFNAHLIGKKLKLLQPLGIESPEREIPRPRLEISSSLVQKALEKSGLTDSGHAFFTVMPYGGWAAKNWDDTKMAEVVDRFAAESGLRAVFLGGPSDRVRIERLVGLLSQPAINLAGRLELAEAAAVISQARLHFGVDTVASHLAAAVDVPSVTLFGPTNPRLIAVLDSRHVAVVKRSKCTPAPKKIYCRFDGGRGCREGECFAGLVPEQVLSVLFDLWLEKKFSSSVIEF